MIITPDILNRLGVIFKQKGSEFIIDCPYCGKPGHLYLNESGAFKCHHCQESGGWKRLATEYNVTQEIVEPPEKQYKFPDNSLADSCFKKLLGPNGTRTIEYLTSRKIPLSMIHRFRLGMDRQNDKDLLCIPIVENDKCVNIKYRTVPPDEKSYTRYPGGKTALFNGDILKTLKDTDAVYITEGEIDCISLVSLGFNAIGITGGAGTIIPAWIKQLEKFKRIYLCYDNDEPGQKGAKEIGKRLGIDRVYNITLDKKDVNQWVIDGGTSEQFQLISDNAQQFELDNVSTLQTAFADLIKEYEKSVNNTHLVSQWPSVHNLTGAFQPGDLIVVSAKEKTGKTTYCLNEVFHWARAGHPVLFYCLEMRPSRVLKKLLQIATRSTEEQLTPVTMSHGYERMADYPIYLGYNYKKCSADVVFETIKLAWKRYGVDAVVFDNLHYLARDIAHQTQEVGLITRTFKMLAEELEIPIILIAQPRKIARDDIMGVEDLKDSSSIGADADQVIILWREKTKANGGAQESFKPELLVRVDASRYKAGGETVLYYDGARSIVTEIRKN